MKEVEKRLVEMTKKYEDSESRGIQLKNQVDRIESSLSLEICEKDCELESLKDKNIAFEKTIEELKEEIEGGIYYVSYL
jgi:anti-sigma28 factor (negative regulator of flagellin synthesis)